MKQGKLTYPDGSIYIGQLLDRTKHGEGTYTTCTSNYIGNFENDNYHGFGTLETDAFVYVGQFSNSNFHGQGKLKTKKQLIQFNALLLFEFNEIISIEAVFNNADINGPSRLQTLHFDFLGAITSNQFTAGCFVFHSDLTLKNQLFIPKNTEFEIDFTVSPWNLQLNDIKYLIECNIGINPDFSLHDDCKISTQYYTFNGTCINNMFQYGQLTYKIPLITVIDPFISQNIEVALPQILHEISPLFDVPDLSIITPFDVDFFFEFNGKIKSFEGEFYSDLPFNGKFIFENGVVFEGTQRSGMYIGNIVFKQLEIQGAIQNGKLEGKCNIQYNNDLYKINVNGTFKDGLKQGDFIVAADDLTFSGVYKDNFITGISNIQFKYFNVEFSCFQGTVQSLRLKWNNIGYFKDEQHEILVYNGDEYNIERAQNGSIVLFYNQAIKFNKNYLKTPEFKYIGEIYNLKIIGQGVYEDQQKIVTGFYDSVSFNGKCVVKYKFPIDFFMERNNVVQIQGQFVNDQLQGQAIVTYENSIFTGNYINNEKYEGIWQFADVRFDGLFQNNIFIKGQILQGDMILQGNFGQGDQLRFKDVHFSLNQLGAIKKFGQQQQYQGAEQLAILLKGSESYQGQLSNNLYHGDGVLKTTDYTFIGMFDNGIIKGQGELEDHATKTKYKGNFQFGTQITGRFEMVNILDSNIKYEGDFINGIKQGSGTLITEDYIYIGDFDDNEFNGNGNITYTDETHYLGLFYRGFKNGQGSLTTTAFTYIGQFKYDVIHGSGQLFINAISTWEQDYFVYNNVKLSQISTGVFDQGNFVSGEIKFVDYTINGDIDNNSLVKGTFQGSLKKSSINKLLIALKFNENDQVLIDGEFVNNMNLKASNQDNSVYIYISNNYYKVELINSTMNTKTLTQMLIKDQKIDENFKSQIHYLNSDSQYFGFITQDIKIGQYGSLTTPEFNFEGMFINELPYRGKIIRQNYSFNGILNHLAQPTTGELQLQNGYLITGTFDQTLNPIGICKIQYSNGNIFQGFYKNNYEFGCGSINGNNVTYIIESVPDILDQYFLRTYKEKLLFGTIDYPDKVFTGKICQGQPSDFGTLKRDNNMYYGTFIQGVLQNIGSSLENIKFSNITKFLQQFDNLIPQNIIQPLQMKGQGQFQNDTQINIWSYEFEDISYEINYDNQNFNYISNQLTISVNNTSLSIKTSKIQFDGDTDLRGQYCINDTMQYTGRTINGKFNGNGVLKCNNFSYKGQFIQGKFHGIGVVKLKEYQYSGQFKLNKQNGVGVQKYLNGDVFQGQFIEGKPYHGKMIYSNGDIYEGQM
ncbi:putative Phosphatidylinositol-4-phosphate 5-kinase [Spironucleus salmonicida]|uniref:Phosphatidylinositol-4-phosphate 5-kinase n=1 Tax=Spironucleus salmonicida TaxID=348837 RepID=V6LS54_9EUKA|nr:putative Phosphatidylinositol-4-phosphate 5-kinase [Spironucleus salmonicida]|eukprot:EST46521.1 hypothetical protein SS50377_13326 [Spironucleus salmonicida]